MLLKSKTQLRGVKITQKPQKHFRTQSNEFSSGRYSSRKKHTKKKNHKRAVSSNLFTLVPLEGKDLIKAPKIFDNQVFCDVYDNKGNHDRIVEVSTDNDTEFDKDHQFILPELLQLPTAGRNKYNTKKIRFF